MRLVPQRWKLGVMVYSWKVSDPTFGVASSFGDLRGRLAMLCIDGCVEGTDLISFWGMC